MGQGHCRLLQSHRAGSEECGVLRHRASCYGSLKQWDKAIADCTKAIELEPKNAGVWWQRAVSYELLKQWDKALADFTKAIELDPKNVRS